MKEESPSMAHQSSSESDDQIPPQPLELKELHQPKDNIMDQEQEEIDSDYKDDTNGLTPAAAKTHVCNNMKIALKELVLAPSVDVTQGSVEPEAMAEDNGRERLKRHRVSVAGRVWIPDIWGQEDLLKDWIDCTAFDAPLVPSRIMMARAALVQEGRRASSGELRIENRC